MASLSLFISRSMPRLLSAGTNPCGLRKRSMSSEKRSISPQPLERLVPPLNTTCWEKAPATILSASVT